MTTRRPLYFISREKEWELIQKLLTIVDNRTFDPADTAMLMVSPDYSATYAMHLAHAWSKDGLILPIIPIHVTYPNESLQPYIERMQNQEREIMSFTKLVLVEACIIRGTNWMWILDVLINDFGYKREDITLIAACENIHSKVKSDYVGEYYDDEKFEHMMYFERYNKNWPVR